MADKSSTDWTLIPASRAEIEQVRDVVEKSAKSVALLIQRGPDKIFIPVRLG